MAKETGLSITTLSVDDAAGTPNDLRNDITSFDFATPRAVIEVTGVDKAATERLLGIADFTISMEGVFNDGAGKSHMTFRTVSSTSVPRTVTLTMSGQTLANECLFPDYKCKRSDKAELTWSTEGSLADGVVPIWTGA